MRSLIAVMAILVLVSCTDVPTATRAVDDLGLTDIEVTGYRWFGCGDDYTFHTGFRAKNHNGKIVTGVVCSSWLKGVVGEV